MLQSCSINSEITYHNDAASTSVIDINTKDFMTEMMAMTPDSLKQKEFGEMDKLPILWTSMYDIALKDGKLKTENPDSIKIMKKIFMKSTKEEHKLTSLAFKMEHFNAEDYKALKTYTKKEKLPIDQNSFNDWDGKTLIVNTENFNLKNIEEAIRTKSPEGEAEKMAGMMMMFFKNVKTTLKFDHKIKVITGNHDWLKQVDDYSVKIEYDLKTMYNKEAKLQNDDKKIIIVTE